MSDPAPPRERILDAAHRLISAQGADAVTTRAVSDLAGVQAPTLYRLFGDKDGLMDALAERVFLAYAEAKAGQPRPLDPVEALRSGWDSQVEFALQNPEVFRLMASRPGPPSPAVERGIVTLRAKIRDVAAAGRLRLSEDRAVLLFHASATGVILTLLRDPVPDVAVSVIARDATIAALTGAPAVPPQAGVAGAALALAAQLEDTKALTAGERLLLTELLQRLSYT